MLEPISATIAGGLKVGSAAFSAKGAKDKAKADRRAEQALIAQQRKAINAGTENRERLIAEARGNLSEIFGTNPDQINVTDQQIASALGNLQALPQIQDTVNEFNAGQAKDNISRALLFDPNFLNNLSALSDQATSYINGEIPQDTQSKVIRDRAGLTASIGIPGSSQEATARDLGLTSQNLRREGQSIFQQVNNIRDQVSPLSNSINANRFFLDPSAYISVQEANNRIDASPTKGLGELLALQLQGSANDTTALASLGVPKTTTAGINSSAFGGLLGSLANSVPTPGVGG